MYRRLGEENGKQETGNRKPEMKNGGGGAAMTGLLFFVSGFLFSIFRRATIPHLLC
jgi:hypothetical protein